LSSGGRSSERTGAFSYLSGPRHTLVMLLSEMTFNAGSVPWHVLAGWVLLALALWVGGITVVRRRSWLVKVGGGVAASQCYSGEHLRSRVAGASPS
jgi:thiosulfate reductase cytochrome b subunit